MPGLAIERSRKESLVSIASTDHAAPQVEFAPPNSPAPSSSRSSHSEADSFFPSSATESPRENATRLAAHRDSNLFGQHATPRLSARSTSSDPSSNRNTVKWGDGRVASATRVHCSVGVLYMSVKRHARIINVISLRNITKGSVQITMKSTHPHNIVIDPKQLVLPRKAVCHVFAHWEGDHPQGTPKVLIQVSKGDTPLEAIRLGISFGYRSNARKLSNQKQLEIEHLLCADGEEPGTSRNPHYHYWVDSECYTSLPLQENDIVKVKQELVTYMGFVALDPRDVAQFCYAAQLAQERESSALLGSGRVHTISPGNLSDQIEWDDDRGRSAENSATTSRSVSPGSIAYAEGVKNPLLTFNTHPTETAPPPSGRRQDMVSIQVSLANLFVCGLHYNPALPLEKMKSQPSYSVSFTAPQGWEVGRSETQWTQVHPSNGLASFTDVIELSVALSAATCVCPRSDVFMHVRLMERVDKGVRCISEVPISMSRYVYSEGNGYSVDNQLAVQALIDSLPQYTADARALLMPLSIHYSKVESVDSPHALLSVVFSVSKEPWYSQDPLATHRRSIAEVVKEQIKPAETLSPPELTFAGPSPPAFHPKSAQMFPIVSPRETAAVVPPSARKKSVVNPPQEDPPLGRENTPRENTPRKKTINPLSFLLTKKEEPVESKYSPTSNPFDSNVGSARHFAE